MADYQEQYNAADFVTPISLVRLAVSWIGAIASVALVIGLVYWVFQLGIRDPNKIPIIHAMEGPARTQPENPGGEQANHQGLAVNSVQSEGTAEKPAETVVLAPRQQSLAAEDLAQDALAKIQPVIRPINASVNSLTVTTSSIEDAIIADIKTEQTPTIQDPSLETKNVETTEQSTVIPSSKYAPLQSIIPRQRPGDLSDRIEAATTIVSQTDTTLQSVPIGTRLVQLGAYDSEKSAVKEWDKLIGKHSDLLNGKARLVHVAESGGRKFYHLHAMGFETAEDSRDLCSALMVRGTQCIPARTQ